jgi:hypothetical protein
MSFFNFNYDPNNPRVGDRVIVTGDDDIKDFYWFRRKKGGEYHISSITEAGLILLSSPFDDDTDEILWYPDQLSAAPEYLERGEHVRVALTIGDSRYTSCQSWAPQMEAYVGLMLVVFSHIGHFVRPVPIPFGRGLHGFVTLTGARGVNDWVWNREWAYIVPDLEAAASVIAQRNEQPAQFKEGDLVLVKGSISNGITNGKGIIRCASPRQPLTYRIEMYGRIQVVNESRLILIERDGQHVFERNSIAAKDLVL